jgi:hypothetical protein
LFPADPDALGALGLGSPPDAHERVLLPLAADRRLVGVAGQHANLGRKLHQDVHHRAADLLEVSPAHRVLEEHVSRAAQFVVDYEGQMVVLVPGCLERAHGEPAGLEVALDDRDAVAGTDLVVACDVIGIGVGREQMRDGQAVPFDGLEERLERRPRIDEDGRPTRFVADQVGVGEPAGVHAPLDDHRR